MGGETRYQRLFVDGDLGAGARLSLGGDQAHYLRDVMRRRPGDPVGLFNGRDGEWLARIATIDRRSAELTVDERLREQAPAPDLWLVFAPVKGGRVEGVVEKATELGVALIQPVITERSVVDRINAKRLRARAVEAAEQCGRLTVPEIAAPRRLLDAMADWPRTRAIAWCDESGGGAAIAEVAAARGPGPWAVMTGPEGGYASSELDALRKLPFVTAVSLGDRILRADTAAIAALACVQAIAGDWRGTAPPADAR